MGRLFNATSYGTRLPLQNLSTPSTHNLIDFHVRSRAFGCNNENGHFQNISTFYAGSRFSDSPTVTAISRADATAPQNRCGGLPCL